MSNPNFPATSPKFNEWTAKVEALQAEVERLKREDQRQAAPFSKGTRMTAPSKPGRKPGTRLFRSRAAPEPDPLSV